MDIQRELPPVNRTNADERITDRQAMDPMRHHGAEWGLASLLTSGFFCVGALVFLVLAVTTLMMGNDHFDHKDVLIITALHAIFTVVVLPLNVLSLIAGLKGLFSARSRNQPVAFGLMGFLLSSLALGLWICAIVAGFAVMLSV